MAATKSKATKTAAPGKKSAGKKGAGAVATKKISASAASATAPTPKPKAASKGSSVAQILGQLAALQRRLPALTDDERTAYRERFDDGRCARTGAETQSLAVLREVAASAITIGKTLATHGSNVARYSQQRLAWLVENATALGHAIEDQASAQGSASKAKGSVVRLEGKARALRDDLVGRLEDIPAAGDDASHDALAQARGTAQTPSDIASSLGALASLGRAWSIQPGATWQIRIDEAGLDDALFDTADAAAEALSNAIGDKREEGTAAMRDTPATNLIEGRVVLELGVAIHRLAEAKKVHPDIVAVTAGKATRHVIVHTRHAKADDAPPAPPATGAATTTPPATNSTAK